MSYPVRSDKAELLALAARLEDGLAAVEREIAENPAPPMKLVPVPLIGKLVPYNELPEVGVGEIWAAAILGQLGEWEEVREDVSFALSPIAMAACRNCGRVRRLGDLEDGWCYEGSC